MLLDLLSSTNHVSFNIKLAQLLGLHTAVYLSQIIDINEKAIRKNRIKDGFFNLNREYIKTRTTLEPAEQRDIETNLVKLSIIEKVKGKPDTISLNITTLTSIMMTPDEDLLKEINIIANQPVEKKKTKTQQITENLQQTIITNNVELRQAYYDWIDAVIQKDGFMTKQAVISAQNNLDTFANHNLDIALKVLEIATINGYRDITWAITSYNKDYKTVYKMAPPIEVKTAPVSIPTKRPRMSDEVF